MKKELPVKRWANVWTTMGVCVIAATLGCSPDEEDSVTMTGPADPVPGIGYPGLDGTVFDMASFGGALVAGGEFKIADGDSVNGIARWNGSDWSPLGDGVGGPDAKVTSVIEFGGRLFAGGAFTSAGDQDLLNLAEWDGTTWSRVNDLDGASAAVNDAVLFGGGVVFGGDFETIGNVGGNHVAWFDGDLTWETLGEGLNNGVDGTVHALSKYDEDLVVGGNFGRAMGIPSSNAALWNGTEWLPMGAGLDSPVLALAEYEDRLYASGVFGEAIGPWQVADVLEPGDEAGQNLSVAFLDETAFVSYWDEANDAIVVAIRESGGWITSNVETGGVGPYSSIAVSAAGDIWVAYYDSANQDARYGYRAATSATWQTGLVAFEGDVGANCDIALDPDGLPAICFDDTDSTLVVLAEAVPIGGGVFNWTLTTLEAPPDPLPGQEQPPQTIFSTDGAIVVDDQRRVHVAYYETTDQDPRYACRGCDEDDPDAWLFEAFQGATDSGRYMDITLDPVGRPTVSFFVQLNPVTTAIFFTGRDPVLLWAPRQAVAINPTSPHSSLVFNPITGNPSVAYGDSRDNLALTVATRGATWAEDKVPLDPGENAAAFVGIGLSGGRDVVVISYNGDEQSLRVSDRVASTPVRRLARWDGSSWESVGGLSNWARDLMVFEGRLYVAGDFTEVDGLRADGLASWNGSSWSVPSTGSDQFAWSLGVYDGRLVVGGGFTAFGGQEANHIAFAP